MDLAPYVDTLRRELAAVAEAGGDDARELAQHLTTPLDAATRLVLLEALSAAAAEITRDLAPGSVEVRLRGRDPELVVTPPVDDTEDEVIEDDAEVPLGASPEGPPVRSHGATPRLDADEGTSRITLRLPEHLKPRIDEAAGRAGLSVNAWLVRVVSAALEPGARERRPARGRGTQFGRRYTGWVR